MTVRLVSCALERDLAILLAEEDVEEIGASLEAGSAAVVRENTLGGGVRFGGAQIGRGTAGQRADPDPSDHRRGRSRPPSRNERSMKMGLLRDRGDRPALLGPVRVMTGAKIAAIDVRTDGMAGVTGGTIAATGVAGPGCCGGRSMDRRLPKAIAPSPLWRTTRAYGSVTP
jgi:hypothetical protein